MSAWAGLRVVVAAAVIVRRVAAAVAVLVLLPFVHSGERSAVAILVHTNFAVVVLVVAAGHFRVGQVAILIDRVVSRLCTVDVSLSRAARIGLCSVLTERRLACSEDAGGQEGHRHELREEFAARTRVGLSFLLGCHGGPRRGALGAVRGAVRGFPANPDTSRRVREVREKPETRCATRAWAPARALRPRAAKPLCPGEGGAYAGPGASRGRPREQRTDVAHCDTSALNSDSRSSTDLRVLDDRWSAGGRGPI